MKKLITVRYFLGLLLGICFISCGNDKVLIQGETEWQLEQNALFKDASRSPLTDKDRKKFKSLDFFKYNENFVVTAYLERTPGTPYMKMKTTTDDFNEERIYGVLSFKIEDNVFQLNAYQSKEAMNTPGYENYLFLPFLDQTNGDQSYGGGRYIDLRIPEGDSIVIDFNKAYNPYCVYNERYSCPLVPRENFVNYKIEAGMKNFNN